MRLASKQDVEAPINAVFARVSDFDSFTRQAMRRGAEVRRKPPESPVGLGAAWQINLAWRGRERHFEPEVTIWEPPSGFCLHSVSGGMVVDCRVDLVALTPARTRLTLSFDAQGKSLTARLLLQSLRLTRSNLTKRLDLRLAEFCTGIDGQRRP